MTNTNKIKQNQTQPTFPINNIPQNYTGTANILIDNYTVQTIEIWKAKIIKGKPVKFIKLIDVQQY